MSKKHEKIITLLVCVALLVLFLAVYRITINDDGYQILLKNRMTKLGYGVNFCSQSEEDDCMSNHNSSFEIWHFAHTVHGGSATNRLYPAFASIVSENHPIRWTSEIKIKSLDEIEGIFNKSIDMSKAGTNSSLELTGKNNEKITVVTCNEYFGLKDKGYYARTTYDIAMESWFQEGCEVLKLLSDAKPSEISYLSEFRLSVDAVNILPPTFGFQVSGDNTDKAEKLAREGKKFIDYDKDIEVKMEDNDTISIEGEGYNGKLSLLAWGDFNGDGIEDLMFNVYYHTSGSYSHNGFQWVTKLSENAEIHDITNDIE